MADEEQLRILRKGVEAWNRWREKHPDLQLIRVKEKPHDASASKGDSYRVIGNEMDLSGATLSGMDLSKANLSRVDLRGADLRGAHLRGADLRNANLNEANLRGADLYEAELTMTKLRQADLGEANLSGARLKGTYLHGAGLSGAKLSGAVLDRTRLDGADLSRSEIGWTAFGNLDLSGVKGLESVVHHGPSTIGIDTIYASRGQIPEAFLRGCGVPDDFIAYMRSLAGRPIEYYSCFISYSSKDQAFAERLHADLQAKGVRCWFAPEDMKIGDKIWDRLDQSIRLHDKLLVILSGNSIGSEWVEDEVTTAFEEERKRGKTVLFPVRLDDAVLKTGEAWAGKARQRHIGDFTRWKEHDAYRVAFERLVRDLRDEGRRTNDEGSDGVKR